MPSPTWTSTRRTRRSRRSARRAVRHRRPPFAVDVTDAGSCEVARGRRGRGLRNDRRVVQQRGHRRRGDGRRDIARAVGAGDGRQCPRRFPRRQGRPANADGRPPRLDREHVLDDRRDRARAPRLVCRLEGCRARADAADAGRLRVVRHPRERTPPRHDPHAVRRSLPRRKLRRPGRRPRSAPSGSDRRPRPAGRRRCRGPVPGIGRITVRPGSGLFVDGGVRGAK